MPRQARLELLGALQVGNTVASLLLTIGTTPAFQELDLFQTINRDYRTMEHSTRGRPLAALRQKLRRHRLPEAKRVQVAQRKWGQHHY